MRIRRTVLLGAGLNLALIAGLGSACLWCQSTTRGSPSPQAHSSDSSEAEAEQARRAFVAGNYQEAIKLYEELIKKAPGVAEIHSNLAAAYYLSGRFAAAAREAQLALKLKPTLMNAHYFLGVSLAESGYCRQALPYLEKDFLRVRDSRLKRTIGTDALRCSMALNDVSKALDYYRVLSREFPSDPELLYLTAHLFSDLSAQASQRLMATAPGSYQFHRMNAEVLEIQGKLQDAIAEYRKVLNLDPHVTDVHYEIGDIMLKQSHDLATLREARKEFEAELQIDPGNAAAEFQLGKIAGITRDWKDAIAHFGNAARLDPDMVPALVALGQAYASAGRVEDAVAPLKRATELDPQNVDAHYRLSVVYRRLGRNQEADRELAAYKKANETLLKLKQEIRAGASGAGSNSEGGNADQ
jgi:tetratricopeptide (TPR) repeat protein